jgi:hypothetical protein
MAATASALRELGVTSSWLRGRKQRFRTAGRFLVAAKVSRNFSFWAAAGVL